MNRAFVDKHVGFALGNADIGYGLRPTDEREKKAKNATNAEAMKPIPESNPSESYRTEKHDQRIPRNHRWQPPIIPHHIKGYQITKNVNTCMTCHGRKSAKESGATPVAKSHYLDRDGKELPNISARRYFCLQCHTPQYDAPPLVGNSFEGPK